MQLANLPPEILRSVVGFLPTKDIVRFSKTNKRLRDVVRSASTALLASAKVDLRFVGFDDTSVPRIVLVFRRGDLIDPETGEHEEAMFALMDDNEDFLIGQLPNLFLSPIFSSLLEATETRTKVRFRDCTLPPTLVLKIIDSLEKTISKIGHVELQGTDLPPDATSVIISFLDAYQVESLDVEDLTQNRRWMRAEFFEAIKNIERLSLGRPPAIYAGRNGYDFEKLPDLKIAYLCLSDVCVGFFPKIVDTWLKGERPWTKNLMLEARMDREIAESLFDLINTHTRLQVDDLEDARICRGSLKNSIDQKAKVHFELSFPSYFVFHCR